MSVSAFMMLGGLCGVAALMWLMTSAALRWRAEVKFRRARALERRVMDRYRRAAAINPRNEHLAMLRAHAEALTDRELLALQSIGSRLLRQVSDARRATLRKAARRGSV